MASKFARVILGMAEGLHDSAFEPVRNLPEFVHGPGIENNRELLAERFLNLLVVCFGEIFVVHTNCNPLDMPVDFAVAVFRVRRQVFPAAPRRPAAPVGILRTAVARVLIACV